MRDRVSKRRTVWNVEGPLEECFRAEGMWAWLSGRAHLESPNEGLGAWLDPLKERVAARQAGICVLGSRWENADSIHSSWGAGVNSLFFLAGADHANLCHGL